MYGGSLLCPLYPLLSKNNVSAIIWVVMPTSYQVKKFTRVSNRYRVIARKLEQEQKQKGVEAALVQTFSTNSRGNACYAGYKSRRWKIFSIQIFVRGDEKFNKTENDREEK